MIAYAALLIGLVAAPVATDPRDDADGLLTGRTAGAPMRCIAADRVQAPVVTADGRILYRQSGRRIWMTRALGACPRLDRRAILVVRPSVNQLCRGDQFRIVTNVTPVPSAACRFDAFTPFDKPR